MLDMQATEVGEIHMQWGQLVWEYDSNEIQVGC